MDWSWGSFAIGIATLPALAIVVLLVQSLVVEATERVPYIECGHCDWRTGDHLRKRTAHRRMNVHVMRAHPRASATFLRINEGGEMPIWAAKRIVATQDAAGVKATPLSFATDVVCFLPWGEEIAGAVLFRRRGSTPELRSWRNARRDRWPKKPSDLRDLPRNPEASRELRDLAARKLKESQTHG